MKKRLLFLLPIIFVISSCGNKPYKYVNPEERIIDYGPDVEENIILDGLANESFYDKNSVYRIDHKNGENKYAEVEFGFANKGLLAHAYVHENTIYENEHVVIYEQDSFELYINPNIQQYQLYSNCVQFRISPLLRSETWIGMKSPLDDYAWTYYYVPFRYATNINGKIITEDDQYFDDDYTNSKGVEYEFYIPYSSLGLDYNPKGLDILPAMVTTNSLEPDDHTWSSYNEVDIVDLEHYIHVGNRVYKDQHNNIFNTDFSTPGFILDHQLDEDRPYIVNYGLYDQYAYYNTYGDMFYAKTTVTLYQSLNKDNHPKIGIGSINEFGTQVMFFDPKPTKDNFEALLVEREGNGEWGWSSAPIAWAGPTTYENKITIEIVRKNIDIYYFMNNSLIFSTNAMIFDFSESYPILMTMNHSGKFEDNYFTTDEDIIDSKLHLDDEYLDMNKSTHGFVNQEGTYIQEGISDQYGIFKNGGLDYSMSVDVRLGESLSGDEDPKIGIGEISDSKINAYLFDPKPTKTNFEIVHLTGKNGGFGNNDWVWGDVNWSGEHNYNHTFNLKIVRENSITSFFVDNNLVFTTSNEFSSEISYPMFFTMNHSGTFENVSLIVNG